MKAKLTFIEDVLGTSSSNPDIHSEFIASKAADSEAKAEELAALTSEEMIEKAMTVFPKFEDGTPFLWDYQVKGFLKEAVGALLETWPKQVAVGKSKLSKFTHKRLMDNYVFVTPRKIPFDMSGGAMGSCERPLRAETMRGERVALACSETVPEGSTITIEIKCLMPALEEVMLECLDYGALKGIGQWRNSGKGRFEWEAV